jgi:hypothetical protein
MKYLIVSLENLGIVALTGHCPTANDLMLGLKDCVINTITPTICQDYQKLTHEYVSKNYISIDRSLNIGVLEHIPETFIKMKKLAEERLRLFSIMHSWNQALLSRSNRFASADFASLANIAVKNSIPDINQWHHWVLEHAAIHDIDTEMAYRDLKIIAECDSEIRFRVNSLSLRWSNEINQIDLSNLDYIPSFVEKMKKDYWLDKQM